MEFDLFQNPHPHPLIFYQNGKPDGTGRSQNVCCSKCHQPWRPPAFGCPNCNFLIHQSCLDLPLKICTPFHPHHQCLLSLTTNNDLCNCCGQMPYDKVYRCPKCSFQIDIQCAIVIDTKAKAKASGLMQITKTGEFRHFSDPHPLTLVQEHDQQKGNRNIACVLCQCCIESSSTYFCSLCDSHFHPKCAKMPREILNLDFHGHPLFIFAISWVKNLLCDNCRYECNGFFFGCAQCTFSLHLHCLSSFKHQHNFKYLKKVLRHKCQLCGKVGNGVDWCCSICNLLAHGECTLLPSTLLTFEHGHPLELTYGVDLTENICKICGESISPSYAIYVCHPCSYATHLNCASIVQIQNSIPTEAVDRNKNLNLKNHGILHFSHEHELTLYPFQHNKHCNGCMQSISTQSYGCLPCGFHLHEECAKLTIQHTNSSLHLHELSMVYFPNFVFLCAVCLQYCHGFAYHCEICHYTIDIRCAVGRDNTHPSHQDPLSRSDMKALGYADNRGKPNCRGCGRWLLDDKVTFGCDNCGFYLDSKCAYLPLAVRNRFDEHPLSLTCVNNNKYEGHEYFQDNEQVGEENKSTHDEYYCDICEEERDKDKWFYSCELCCFTAHINCVLGDYPFLQSAKLEGHQHPLKLVEEGKKGYSACGKCGNSCEGNLAFECEDLTCMFNVHASGLCYHNQLTQDRITFTMPSLRYRSIPLYLDPIQRKRSKLILLGRYEGRGGSARNERVFSAIRQFMVNHKRWVDSIQIQYEENEKSFSTKHGEDGDFNYKMLENVGRKVAMSLGQSEVLKSPTIGWDDGAFSSIKQVVITHNEKYIHSIQTQYYDDYGNLIQKGTHGRRDADDIVGKVELALEEYLISIQAWTLFWGITRLILESNKKIYGPFGRSIFYPFTNDSGEIRFSFPSGAAKIVGFHGTSMDYLTSIGVKVAPI